MDRKKCRRIIKNVLRLLLVQIAEILEDVVSVADPMRNVS